jgi:hypothetical protein
MCRKRLGTETIKMALENLLQWVTTNVGESRHFDAAPAPAPGRKHYAAPATDQTPILWPLCTVILCKIKI